jgi:hypothetical protein
LKIFTGLPINIQYLYIFINSFLSWFNFHNFPGGFNFIIWLQNFAIVIILFSFPMTSDSLLQHIL